MEASETVPLDVGRMCTTVPRLQRWVFTWPFGLCLSGPGKECACWCFHTINATMRKMSACAGFVAELQREMILVERSVPRTCLVIYALDFFDKGVKSLPIETYRRRV